MFGQLIDTGDMNGLFSLKPVYKVAGALSATRVNIIRQVNSSANRSAALPGLIRRANTFVPHFSGKFLGMLFFIFTFGSGIAYLFTNMRT